MCVYIYSCMNIILSNKDESQNVNIDSNDRDGG